MMMTSSLALWEQKGISTSLSLLKSYLFSIQEQVLTKRSHVSSNQQNLFPYDKLHLFIVYFRIFDVNEDKKIDHEDLNKVMRMLFGHKLTPEDMKVLREKIFNEVI